MTTLVLGGAGFIGGSLTRMLVAGGHRPRVFNRPSYVLANIKDIIDRTELVYGDFMDDVALRKVLDGVDTVYHLISTTFPSMTTESGVYDVLSNLLPTIRLLEICAGTGVKKIVYASSGGTVYGEPLYIPIDEEHPREPTSAYGQSKLSIENYLHFYARTKKIDVSILRISNPYGPSQNPLGVQGVIAVAMGCALSKRPLKLFGQGEAVRDYIYIDDVVRALILAGEKPGSCAVNISSGVGYSVIQIVEAIEKITGESVIKQFVTKREGDVLTNVLANDRARQLFDWKPDTGLLEGLALTWDWMSKRWDAANP
jgi:UDP-glucose 4-epimerase